MYTGWSHINKQPFKYRPLKDSKVYVYFAQRTGATSSRRREEMGALTSIFCVIFLATEWKGFRTSLCSSSPDFPHQTGSAKGHILFQFMPRYSGPALTWLLWPYLQHNRPSGTQLLLSLLFQWNGKPSSQHGLASISECVLTDLWNSLYMRTTLYWSPETMGMRAAFWLQHLLRLTIYTTQVRSVMGQSPFAWMSTAPTTLSKLNGIQDKAVCLAGTTSTTSTILSMTSAQRLQYEQSVHGYSPRLLW